MLTYTFSTREKIMLAALAFVGVLIVWYRFVFIPIQEEVTSIDAQISSAEDELNINQSRTMQLANMRAAIDTYQGEGYVATLLPSFDNTQNLMAYLNGVLGSAQSYNMSFDTPAVDEDDGTVHRSGTITYNTASYADARSIAEAIARGPYSCEVTAIGITDNTVSNSSANDVVTSLQVTFFEKVTSGTTVESSKKDEVQGQDLSKLSDWNNQ